MSLVLRAYALVTNYVSSILPINITFLFQDSYTHLHVS